MSPDEYLQLFWFILTVTVFCGILVIGGLIADRAERRDYLHYIKLQKAKKAWVRLLTGEK